MEQCLPLIYAGGNTMTLFHPHEDECTEFKRELTCHYKSGKQADTLEKEVVAFLNSAKGGDIYIGVEDDGTIAGVANPDKLQLAIIDRIKNNILPTTLGFFDVVRQEIDGKSVIKVIVTRGLEKPYYLKKYGMSPAGAYIRVGTGIQQLTTKMIDRLYATRTRDSLRNIPSPRKKLSFHQLKIYYDEKGFTVNDSFLENLDLYTPNGELNYVAYLLADQNSVSIKVAKYSGTNKVDLIGNEEYGNCSLVKATERVLDKLTVENKTFTKITGAARRLQKNMIGKTALREALINAMVHNDYTCEVTPVVEIYVNRLTITSYGGLVPGLSKEEFFAGRSMIRNRELMRVYRDLDLVEQLGSGMNRILQAYSKDVFRFSQNFMEVCFTYNKDYLSSGQDKDLDNRQVETQVKTEGEASARRRESVGKASGKRRESVGKASGKRRESVGKASGKILEGCRENPSITIPEMAEKIDITERSVERNIQKLQADGFLRRIGGRKEGHWEVIDE